jgi:hypothetical protein
MKSYRGVLGAFALISAALVLVGCSSTPAKPGSAATAASGPTIAHQIFDPWTDVTNPKSPEFIATGIFPLLHVYARGTHRFTIDRPASKSARIQFLVACSPSAHFTLTMGGFFSTQCFAHVGGTGAIPISQALGDGPLQVTITVPKNTSYWLVGIPYPSN